MNTHTQKCNLGGMIPHMCVPPAGYADLYPSPRGEIEAGLKMAHTVLGSGMTHARTVRKV